MVPGAQTLESLKDLFVFLCIVLFGYPALVTIPLAYSLSDVLIEGVPPEFLIAWLPGYFINPACFWVAYQLFGKNPDFRRLRTWGSYAAFILFFMAVEPVLWGYIGSGQFTSEISYRYITPALFFTTSITWIVAPFAMLAALPLARRWGLFWAEIAGHVQERVRGTSAWVWEAGRHNGPPAPTGHAVGLPIRMFLLTPFVAIVLIMVGVTAYVTLESAARDATKLATRLHQEISLNIKLRLNDHLSLGPTAEGDIRFDGIDSLLATLPISQHGHAFVIDRSGGIIASSVAAEHEAAAAGVDDFIRKPYREEDLLTRIGNELGVSYVYVPILEDGPGHALGAAVDPELLELLDQLPADLIEELRHAAIRAHATQIHELADRVEEHSAIAAKRVRALSRNFQYDVLLAALDVGASL